MTVEHLDPNLIRSDASSGSATATPDAIDRIVGKINEVIDAGGGAVGPGTSGRVARFDSTSTIGNASASDDGAVLTIPSVNHGFGTLGAALPAGLTDDWNPWGSGPFTSVLRVQTPQILADEAEAILGGIVQPAVANPVGTFLYIIMHGNGSGVRATSDLLIKDRSTTSAITARIRVPEADNSGTPGALLRVPYTGGVLLYYDAVNVSWIIIGLAVGGRFQRCTVGDLQFTQASPAALSAGNNNDYTFTGIGSNTWIRVQPNTGAILTGIDNTGMWAGGNYTPDIFGSVRVIENCGFADVTISHQDTASAVGNRFALPNGSFRLGPKQTILVGYDLGLARWVLLAGETGMMGKQSFNGKIDDLALGANVNDYNPAGFATTTVMRLASAAATALSGMVAQEDGAIRIITAYSGGITLTHQDAASAAANRFYLPGAANKTLAVAQSVTCLYDGSLGAWMLVGSS